MFLNCSIHKHTEWQIAMIAYVPADSQVENEVAQLKEMFK